MLRVMRKTFGIVIAAIVFVAGSYILACVIGGSSLAETVAFLGRFIEDPSSVGAIAPSSRLLATALVAKVTPGGATGGRRFLEVGPGSGAVTQELVPLLGMHGHLDLVELDAELAKLLQEKYCQDSRVAVHQSSITDWKPQEKYDAVVMGIPFNALSFSLVEAIWLHVLSLVKPEGFLSYFSYLWLPSIKKAFLSKHKKRDFKKIQRYLAAEYKAHGVGTQRVLANMPPAIVFYLQPGAEAKNQMTARCPIAFSSHEA